MFSITGLLTNRCIDSDKRQSRQKKQLLSTTIPNNPHRHRLCGKALQLCSDYETVLAAKPQTHTKLAVPVATDS